jgi:hypothetical protein
MDSGHVFKKEINAFLDKVSKRSNNNTKLPVDAFEIGKELNNTEEKTTTIVNYLLEKEFIRTSQQRINSGDPLPPHKFQLIYITTKSIDEVYKEDRKSGSTSAYNQYGDIYNTNMSSTDRSNVQIGTKESSQNLEINEATTEELRSILVDLKNGIKNNNDSIQPERKSEIESGIHELEQELSQHKRDKNRIVKAAGLLYNKINDVTPLAGIALQLVNCIKNFN